MAIAKQTAPRLIVGLGNPGAEYSQTRHNAGFWFCEQLADKLRLSWSSESRFHAQVASLRHAGEPLWLLLPQTFMNRSGQAVRALMQFYRLTPAEVLVVHDELDLPPGQLRLKFGGGAGGHNGLKDISAHLGTQDYWRLRIGSGHPGERSEVVNFVLKPPGKAEQALIDDAITRALEGWPLLVQGDWQAAMRALNIKPDAQA